MDRFYGFDLGDAESAIARLDKNSAGTAGIIPVHDAASFVSAYARTGSGELVIGEEACYVPDASVRKVRFKSRFLTDPQSARDIRSFAAGVLGLLREQGDLIAGEDNCFYIGCPAGWDKNTRELYREIFEQLGYPPARIVSESRAALVSACQSRHLQVGYDILSRPVLVVDIGSSTTDFAYITEGREAALHTAGEVSLGGGIMDEQLLELNILRCPDAKRIREIFSGSEAWKNYCEFAARRLKEQYFADEEYWSKEGNLCSKTVMIRYDRPVRFPLSVNARDAAMILDGPAASLDGRSFRQVFLSSLREVRANIDGPLPDLLFLTGGVSRLPAIRDWCLEVFPEAVVISGAEPEFAVARGLAHCGKIDEEVRAFKQEVADLIASPKIEMIVEGHLQDLYRMAADTLVEPILEKAVLPVFDRWRSGEIRRLCDVDEILQKEIEAWLHTEEARALLISPVTSWLRPVAAELEEYTMPICVRHHVPYAALNLSSYLSMSDIDIRVDARDVFAVNEITWLIDAIISVLVGLLCGGSGIALITGGLPGIIAGAFLSLLVLLLGRDTMQKAVLRMDIPSPMRKLIPKKHFRSRLDSLSGEVKSKLSDSLATQKNDEISQRMAQEISSQIESCLTKMAEVVEIPLG